MDPETTKIDKIKLAICSLHFHDGYPTDQYPLPTELLSNKTPEQKIEFKGTKNNENCDSGINDQDIIETDEELETAKFSQLVNKFGRAEFPFKHRFKAAILAKRKRRRWIPSADYNGKLLIPMRYSYLMKISLKYG